MRVYVTEGDIDVGERGSTTHNPVAIAFSRAVGSRVAVYQDRGNGDQYVAQYLENGDSRTSTVAALPEVAQRFLRWWSYGPGDPKYPPHPGYEEAVQPFEIYNDEPGF